MQVRLTSPSRFLLNKECANPDLSAAHYLKPWEQRHVIRILFMVPIYAVVSFLSYKYYRHTIYFEVIRDCYEAFAIASFFALLCHYIGPDLRNQKDYFRQITPKPWLWPASWMQKCCGGSRGWARTPRSGLTWFNVGFKRVLQKNGEILANNGRLSGFSSSNIALFESS